MKYFVIIYIVLSVIVYGLLFLFKIDSSIIHTFSAFIILIISYFIASKILDFKYNKKWSVK